MARTSRTKRTSYEVKIMPYLKEIRTWCEMGLSQKQIAQNLGISESTLYKTFNENPDFREAFDRWRMPLNIEIENTFYKKVKGYYYDHYYIDTNTGEQKTIPRYIPPSDPLLMFALKNNMPVYYKDKHEVELTETEIIVDIVDEDEEESSDDNE